MPELPEVEVTRRTIAQSLRGATVSSVRLGKPLRWPLGCAAQSLAGRVIGEVARRGKYLWMPLGPRPGHPANDEGGLLLHLGMSGSLSLAPTAPSGPHDHFEMDTSAGTLRLRDPRRFGAVLWSASLDTPPAAALLRRLGPEPFDPALTPQSFHAALQRHRGAIKTVILGGSAMVGAGNIYACEALFRAGIDPRTASDRISRPRAARLLAALRETLAQAIALGGSTLRDFRDAHGMDGAYQAHAGVYGREGQPCPACNATVRRIVQAQRATCFCPRCQRR